MPQICKAEHGTGSNVQIDTVFQLSSLDHKNRTSCQTGRDQPQIVHFPSHNFPGNLAALTLVLLFQNIGESSKSGLGLVWENKNLEDQQRSSWFEEVSIDLQGIVQRTPLKINAEISRHMIWTYLTNEPWMDNHGKLTFFGPCQIRACDIGI